jgi:hypothetical protein
VTTRAWTLAQRFPFVRTLTGHLRSQRHSYVQGSLTERRAMRSGDRDVLSTVGMVNEHHRPVYLAHDRGNVGREGPVGRGGSDHSAPVSQQFGDQSCEAGGVCECSMHTQLSTTVGAALAI